MEFGKERTICTLIKSFNGYSVTLDEILHHLHTIYITILPMHHVDIVLPTLGKVLFCHYPDLVGFIDDVIFAHLIISPVDREICPHHHTPDKSLFLVLYGIHLWDVLLVKCLEIGHNCRIIHQGYLKHTCLRIRDDCVIYRYSTNCHYHSLVLLIYTFVKIRKPT